PRAAPGGRREKSYVTPRSAAEAPSVQAPRSRETSSTKLQIAIRAPAVFGFWNFELLWCLELLTRLLRGDQFLPQLVIEQNLAEKFGVADRAGRGGIGIEREANAEGGAFAGFAVGVDLAAVVMNDEVARHQMDAVFHGAVAADDERVKNEPQRLLWEAGTIVADLDEHAGTRSAIISFSFERDFAASGQGGEFVFEHELEQTIKFRLVHPHGGQRRGNFVFDPDVFRRETRFQRFDAGFDDFAQLHLVGEFKGRLFRSRPEVLEQVVDALNLALHALVIFLPEIRVPHAVEAHFFLGHFAGGQIKEGFDGDERVADVMAQAGGEQAEADNAVGDHHVVQHGHFFAQQLVALVLDHEKFQSVPQRFRELLRVPGLGHVFVNRARIDGGDGGVHVRKRGGQDANGARL